MMTRRRLRPGLATVLLSGLLVLLAAYSLTPVPMRSDSPPATLEAAVLAGDWERIDIAAAAWTQGVGWRREAAVLRGYAALARGEVGDAVRHFLRARSRGSKEGDTRWAEELGGHYPTRPVAQLLAGDALARRGAHQASLTRLDAALALAPELDIARVARGMVQVLLGEPAAALRDLDPLIVESAVVAEALTARGLVHLAAGQLDQALTDLQRALELAPDHAVAYNARGIIHARRHAWSAAVQDFERAFQQAPELVEARHNWQVAQQAMAQRGTVLAEKWQLSVFATGIKSEADFKYATSHARALVDGHEPTYLYVGIKGHFPLAGVANMRQQGVATVVVDPRNPDAAGRQVEQFITRALDAGKNPTIFVDINKWVPKQLGNNKPEAVEFPARLAVHALLTFQREVGQRGGQALSTFAGHSDGTWVMAEASKLASQHGVPATRVYLESPRSEALVTEVVRFSPATQFTVVQPVRGDLWTAEAQQRALQLKPGAYQQTIETLKNVDAPNYRLALIENPSRLSPSLLHPAGAHSDPTDYGRPSEVAFWRGGKQLGAGSGPLGQVLSPQPALPPSAAPTAPSTRGGIWLGPVQLTRGAGGRIVFGTSAHSGEELRLVYTLFGTDEASGTARLPDGH